MDDREILEAALVGLETELDRINTSMAGIQERLGKRGPGRPPSRDGAQPKRKMSAAARKRIGEATRQRWAAFRAAKTGKTAAKPKRRISAEGRAAIVAATQKRWAEFRKQKAAAERGTAKKTAAKRKTALKSRMARVLTRVTPVAAPAMP